MQPKQAVCTSSRACLIHTTVPALLHASPSATGAIRQKAVCASLGLQLAGVVDTLADQHRDHKHS